jgi:hypothetical protein
VLNITDNYKSRILNVNDVDLFIRAPAANLQQKDCVKNKGLWNYDDRTCYKYYVKYLLIIDFKITVFNYRS